VGVFGQAVTARPLEFLVISAQHSHKRMWLICDTCIDSSAHELQARLAYHGITPSNEYILSKYSSVEMVEL